MQNYLNANFYSSFVYNLQTRPGKPHFCQKIELVALFVHIKGGKNTRKTYGYWRKHQYKIQNK